MIHPWTAIAGAAIWLVIRLLKSDAIPINVPARWRPVLALVLGIASGVAEGLTQGRDWQEALLAAATAAFGAIGFQETAVKGLLGLPPSTEPPKPKPPVLPIILGCLLLGCTGSQAEKLTKFAETSRDVATFAEGCAVEQKPRDVDACKGD